MATATDIQKFQGNDIVGYFRKLKNASLDDATMLPAQTSAEFDPQRDSDSTDTKDGSFATMGSLETDVEVDFINNTSKVADNFWDSIMNKETLEIWLVNRKRKDKDGKYFAWYMRGTVSEDDNSNDAGDISERDTSFSISGQPQRGWLQLSADQQDELDYIFRGLDKVTGEGTNTEQNGGTPWSDKDAGVNEATSDIPDIDKTPA